MAANIASEAGALKAGADAVADAKQKIDTTLGKVRDEIGEMATYWSGSAAGAFTGLMGQWNEQSSKLNEVLITLEDALRGTERDQAQSEEQHQATIAGLGSMMNG